MAASSREFNPAAALAPAETDFSAWKGFPGFYTTEEVLKKVDLFLDTYRKWENWANHMKEKAREPLKSFDHLLQIEKLTKANAYLLGNKQFFNIYAYLKDRLSTLDGGVYPSSFYLEMLCDKAAIDQSDSKFHMIEENQFLDDDKIMKIFCLDHYRSDDAIHMDTKRLYCLLPYYEVFSELVCPETIANSRRLSFPFHDYWIETDYIQKHLGLKIWASILLHNFLYNPNIFNARIEHLSLFEIDSEIKCIILELKKKGSSDKFENPAHLLSFMITQLIKERNGIFGRRMHSESLIILNEALEAIKTNTVTNDLIDKLLSRKSLDSLLFFFVNMIYVKNLTQHFFDTAYVDKVFFKVALKLTFNLSLSNDEKLIENIMKAIPGIVKQDPAPTMTLPFPSPDKDEKTIDPSSLGEVITGGPDPFLSATAPTEEIVMGVPLPFPSATAPTEEEVVLNEWAYKLEIFPLTPPPVSVHAELANHLRAAVGGAGQEEEAAPKAPTVLETVTNLYPWMKHVSLPTAALTAPVPVPMPMCAFLKAMTDIAREIPADLPASTARVPVTVAREERPARALPA